MDNINEKNKSSYILNTKQKDFLKEIKELVGKEYEVLSQYNSPNSYVKFIHKKCNLILYFKPMELLEGKRCGSCSKGINQSIKSIKKTCERCNSEFLVSKDEVLYSNMEVVWCSEECKSYMKEYECKNCGRKFMSKAFRAYCSEECKKDICKVCGNIYVRKNNETYCSEECKKILYKHICKCCGKEFYYNGNKKFCSFSCKTAYASMKSEIFICKNCKTAIRYKGIKPEFCCAECRVEYNSKKKTLYKKKIEVQDLYKVISYKINILINIRKNAVMNLERVIDYRLVPGFNNLIKEKVKYRDYNKCFICENKMDLDIHHIIPQRLGGAHKEDNLITLCRKCHRYVETGNESYATYKCLENAKKYYGIIDLNSKSFEKTPIKIQLENLEKDLSKFFEKLEEIEVDDSLELRENLADIIDDLSNCIIGAK
ncbi:MAG: HNH endonuclease [Clostridiaceae bacterium]